MEENAGGEMDMEEAQSGLLDGVESPQREGRRARLGPLRLRSRGVLGQVRSRGCNLGRGSVTVMDE